jgi:flagellar biosynthesis activator protein FlaF
MQRANIYEQVQREALDGRELEASVLFRAAQKLNYCAREWENGHTKEFHAKLTDALEFNQKVWTFLQVELSNPANPLPETLRLNLLRLSKFIDKRIFALFAGGGTAEDLLSIARINEQIAKGLEAGTTPPLATDLDEGDPTPLRLLDIAG